METRLIAYAQMIEDITAFRALAHRTAAQQAMIDLLDTIERTPAEHRGPFIETLVTSYKRWKFEEADRG